MSAPGKSYKPIRAVENALSVLEILGEIEDGDSLARLSAKLKLNKSNVFRILTTLKHRGYVDHDEKAGTYRLGIGAYELGQKFLSRMDLLNCAKPLMEGMVRECGETLYLAVPKGGEMLMFYKVDAGNPVSIRSLVGKRFAVAAGEQSVPGEPLLLRREEFQAVETDEGDRSRGPGSDKTLQFDFGSLEEDVANVAAPIYNGRKGVSGCLCFVAPRYRFSEEDVQNNLVASLRVGSEILSTRLAGP